MRIVMQHTTADGHTDSIVSDGKRPHTVSSRNGRIYRCTCDTFRYNAVNGKPGCEHVACVEAQAQKKAA